MDDHARGELAQLALMLAAIPVAAWLERKSTDPDAVRLLRMRAAKFAERACAEAAGNCWRWAEWFRLAYERDRP